MENKYRNRLLLIWNGILTNTPILFVVFEKVFCSILIIDFLSTALYIEQEIPHCKKRSEYITLVPLVMEFVGSPTSFCLYSLDVKPNKSSNGQCGHCLGQFGHFGQNISHAYTM